MSLPPMLHQVFSSLLKFSTFLPLWKVAKWIPILKPGRTDASQPKNLRPMSLLSCLSKLYLKVITCHVAEIGRIHKAISPEHMGCLKGISAIDALMLNVSQAQSQLHQGKAKPMLQTPRHPPTLSNGKRRRRSVQLCGLQPPARLRHNRFHSELIITVESFSTERSLFFAIDNGQEPTALFQASLPQGSPLSPILFVIYASALATPPIETHGATTSYIDDELRLQGAGSQAAATTRLQAH